MEPIDLQLAEVRTRAWKRAFAMSAKQGTLYLEDSFPKPKAKESKVGDPVILDPSAAQEKHIEEDSENLRNIEGADERKE